jgi:hypothetical protein
MMETITPARARPQPLLTAPSWMRIALALAALTPACAAHAQEISAAEKLLFTSDHLRNVAPPKELRYSFVHHEQGGQDFRDGVTVDVTARKPDGSAAVSAQFLHGDHAVPLPAIDDARGNPALLGFLERDINEMKRLTGGSASYFRKRIRMALAQGASVRQVSVSYGGRRLQGTEIAIQPYLNDPMRDKMPKFEAKNYVFVFCDAVPGSVYQIRSTVPGPAGTDGKPGGGALIEETMRFDGVKS